MRDKHTMNAGSSSITRREAIMTGLRPDVTKVWDLETHFRVAQPDCITLPQHFKANGYHCSALSKLYQTPSNPVPAPRPGPTRPALSKAIS